VPRTSITFEAQQAWWWWLGEVVPTAGDGAGGPTEVVATAGRSTMGASMGTVDRPTGEEDYKV
jgi:hypothetical protein